MPSVRLSWALPALWLGLGAIPSTAAGLPKVPEGFELRLVASVPAVQNPSQVATAPDESLFVGEDPMDQVGPADKPIDRILLFRDGEDPVVFAEALNAIFGMVWQDGALYVMNMPNLTVLRDADGDGVAEGRRELFTDLGVPACSPNDFNDHIVSGLQIGIDNYLYISVGDKGVPRATGPDGRTAQVVGGGTLRCRLDGTGLEVFSTGARNHLEPNLDARDDLFTYDNTDDGQGWWTRVTHHVDGGHYGYPYDYHDRPDRMLPRMVAEAMRPLLDDPALEVRKRGIAAAGLLEDREAIPALLLAADADPTRFEAIRALAAMPDPRALQVYLRGLGGTRPELRKASAAALTDLGEGAVPILEELARRHELSPSLLPELRRVFTASRPVTGWQILGTFPIEAAAPVSPGGPIDLAARHPGAGDGLVSWKPARPVDARGQVDLGAVFSKGDKIAAFGYAEVQSLAGRPARMSVGSDDTLTVWLNGKRVYDSNDRRSFEHEHARFDVEINSGSNPILVKCGNHGGEWQFSVAVTTAAEYAFLKGPATGGFDPEAFRAFASKGGGKPENGRALFSDLKGLACIKCHAVGGQGGGVGPELSGVGAKYPRDELIAAVLYPSAKISMGFEPIVVAANDGRVLTGIIKSDTPEALEIEDADARRFRIPAADIEERKRSEVSIMPSGLAEGLTQGDLADLIAYLETLKESGPRIAPPSGGSPTADRE